VHESMRGGERKTKMRGRDREGGGGKEKTKRKGRDRV
jgi:hypothetical protein